MNVKDKRVRGMLKRPYDQSRWTNAERIERLEHLVLDLTRSLEETINELEHVRGRRWHRRLLAMFRAE